MRSAKILTAVASSGLLVLVYLDTLWLRFKYKLFCVWILSIDMSCLSLFLCMISLYWASV